MYVSIIKHCWSLWSSIDIIKHVFHYHIFRPCKINYLVLRHRRPLQNRAAREFLLPIRKKNAADPYLTSENKFSILAPNLSQASSDPDQTCLHWQHGFPCSDRDPVLNTRLFFIRNWWTIISIDGQTFAKRSCRATRMTYKPRSRK